MATDLFKVLKQDYFLQYPLDIQDSSDPDFRNLANKINQLRVELVNRFSGRGLDLTIEDLECIYIPEQSPEKVLEHLAYTVGYDYVKSKDLRALRKEIFLQSNANKRVGTLSYLIEAVAYVTGVEPEMFIPENTVTSGWDGDLTIDGNPSPVNFFGGVFWDQINEGQYLTSHVVSFRWRVKNDLYFLNLKNDGVFDPDPIKNAAILEKAYATVARFKDANVPVKVGYRDSVTLADITFRYVYSTDVISVTEQPAPGFISNKDKGIEF